MLKGAWNAAAAVTSFAWRHKWKLVAVGGVAVAGAAAARWVSAEAGGLEAAVTQAAAAAMAHASQREAALGRVMPSLTATLEQLMPLQHKRVFDAPQCDTARPLARLRQLSGRSNASGSASGGGGASSGSAEEAAAQNEALWQELGEAAVTRLLVAGYAAALAAASLRVGLTVAERANVADEEAAREARDARRAAREAAAAAKRDATDKTTPKMPGDEVDGEGERERERDAAAAEAALAERKELTRALLAAFMGQLAGPGLCALLERAREGVRAALAAVRVRTATVSEGELRAFLAHARAEVERDGLAGEGRDAGAQAWYEPYALAAFAASPAWVGAPAHAAGGSRGATTTTTTSSGGAGGPAEAATAPGAATSARVQVLLGIYADLTESPNFAAALRRAVAVAQERLEDETVAAAFAAARGAEGGAEARVPLCRIVPKLKGIAARAMAVPAAGKGDAGAAAALAVAAAQCPSLEAMCGLLFHRGVLPGVAGEE